MMGVGGSDPSGTWKFEYNSAVASLVAQLVKNLPAVGRPGFYHWVGKILWRREKLPTPVFGPGDFHGLCGFCLHDIQRASCPHFLPSFLVSDNYSHKGRKRCVL